MDWVGFDACYLDRFPTHNDDAQSLRLSVRLVCQRVGSEPPLHTLCEMTRENLLWARRWSQTTAKLYARLQGKWRQKSNAKQAQQQVRNALARLSCKREWELSWYGLREEHAEHVPFEQFYLAACIARKQHWWYCDAWDWAFWLEAILEILKEL